MVSARSPVSLQGDLVLRHAFPCSWNTSLSKSDSHAGTDTPRSALAAPVKAAGNLCPVSTLARSSVGGAGVLCSASKLRNEVSTPTRPHGHSPRALCPLWDCPLSPRDPGSEVMPSTSGHTGCVKCWSPLPLGPGQAHHQPERVAVRLVRSGKLARGARPCPRRPAHRWEGRRCRVQPQDNLHLGLALAPTLCSKGAQFCSSSLSP